VGSPDYRRGLDARGLVDCVLLHLRSGVAGA
jgi:hypothetical protein